MTVKMFLGLLTMFSGVTAAIVQGVKNVLNEMGKNYSPTLIACVVALFVGCFGTSIYYIISGTPFNAVNVIYMLLMGAASALGATNGYDCIKRICDQLANI